MWSLSEVVECGTDDTDQVYAAWWFWLTLIMFLGLFAAAFKEALASQNIKCNCNCCKTTTGKVAYDPKRRATDWKIAPLQPSHILTAVPPDYVHKPHTLSTYHLTVNGHSKQTPKANGVHKPGNSGKASSVPKIHVIHVDHTALHPFGLENTPAKKGIVTFESPVDKSSKF